MNYTFHQLKVFLAIVQYEGVTKAAEALHLSQPAVSMQLKNLQDQFEIPLTEVIGRKLYVTEFGRKLAETAERILQEVSLLDYETDSFKGLLSGKLRITAASTGKYVMPIFLSGFLQRNPGIDLNMDVTNKTKVVQSLRDNEVDFSLISVLPDDLELEHETLLPNPLFLMGAGDAKASSLSKAQLRELPLIYREPGSATRLTMQSYIAKAHIIPKVRFELTSNEAVKQAVMAGLGYSIVSLLSTKNELQQKQISILPVKELPVVEYWKLVWRPQRKMSIVAKAFLQYLQQEKMHIYQQHFQWMEAYVKRADLQLAGEFEFDTGRKKGKAIQKRVR
jgi:DNA-binding transcriptional LysR family regulator